MDGMDGLHGAHMVLVWYGRFVPYTNSNKKI